MPQLSIEYSGNMRGAFDPRALALTIHGEMAPIIKTEIGSCKTRLTELKDFVIGEGADEEAMVHIDLRILSGRSEAQKKQAGEAALAAAMRMIDKPAGLNLQLTVEVRELDRDNYHKRVLAP
ncbi:MAG TPA: hypothetical protein VGD10_07160 [Allosphingosinicella sp.]|uniref:5-carboxymethyl-2-hydroxymuconate Delta-isomerase n=1 Tax=Allosphingosinicella sp. TaxID=2823234 RepID=UPI002EDA03F3